METLSRLRWCPHTPYPKQLAFLSLDVKEALYGGAAGGGKSDALLMGALEYVDIPGYNAIIFRRTFADLALPGGLIPRSAEWLKNTAAKWDGNNFRWTFPSGATISFGYMKDPNDHYRYQSSEFQYAAFDELTHFKEHQYRYIFSRLRRLVGVDIPIRIRSGSNPGGVGHKWVFDRFIAKRFANRAFVPALLEDNPSLDREEYDAMLRELDPVEYKRLRWGDWYVQREGLVYPDFESCIVSSLPSSFNGEPGGGIDFGYNNPFAAEWGYHDRDDVIWVVGEHSGRKKAVSDHAAFLPKSLPVVTGYREMEDLDSRILESINPAKLTSFDGRQIYPIEEPREVRYYCDPAGADQIAELRKQDIDAIPSVHIGHRPLEHGIAQVNRRIASGRLKVWEGCEVLRTESGRYHYDETKQDEKPVDEDNHALAALRYWIVAKDRHAMAAAEIEKEATTYAVENRRPDFDDERWW